jgi:beta-lactam-binding protein with PASTA domain
MPTEISPSQIISVPDVSGMSKTEAKAALRELGFTVKVRWGKQEGLRTYPPAGEELPSGSQVSLIVDRQDLFWLLLALFPSW